MFKRFFTTIWTALTDTHAYVDIFARKRIGNGMGYLYWLCVTVTFLAVLPLAIGLIYVTPKSEAFINTHLTVAQNLYPDDLVITLSGGILSTNQDEPVLITLPAEWQSGTEEFTHLVVIDTDATVDDYDAYDTGILLTETAAVARDEKSIRIFTYSELSAEMEEGQKLEPIIINEELVGQAVTGMRAFATYVPWILSALVLILLLAAPFIGGGILWIANVIFLAWATIILWIISALMGRHHRYGELYTLGLFGVTGPLILNNVDDYIGGVNLSYLPWLYFLVWMIVIISQFTRRAPIIVAPPASAKASTFAKASADLRKKTSKPRKSTV